MTGLATGSAPSRLTRNGLRPSSRETPPALFDPSRSCIEPLGCRLFEGGGDAMSKQKEMLREIAQAISGDGPYWIDQWFTEDFRLVEPTKPNWPRGHEGVNKLLDILRTLTPPVRFVALDMVEEADR